MALFAARGARRALATVVLVALTSLGACAWLFRRRDVLPDVSLDLKTTVGPSAIPGGGDGLFAARDLEPGEPIAQMGGRLVFGELVTGDRGYVFRLPACARGAAWPFDAVDGAQVSNRASKANFAPRVINGVETHFQNARGRYVCEAPYVVYEATTHIDAGAEILASYGPRYDYDFMASPAVRDHFCARLELDCSARFDWAP